MTWLSWYLTWKISIAPATLIISREGIVTDVNWLQKKEMTLAHCIEFVCWTLNNITEFYGVYESGLSGNESKKFCWTIIINWVILFETCTAVCFVFSFSLFWSFMGGFWFKSVIITVMVPKMKSSSRYIIQRLCKLSLLALFIH